MNIFVYIYVILYFLYVILGPHFIRRLINKDKLLIANSFTDIFRRMFFLSYIAFLYNAYYFYNPTLETFINSVLINIVVIIGFIIKWHNLLYKDPYYISGIFVHILFLLPVLISYFFINISNTFVFGNVSKITLFILLFYIFIINLVYKN